MYKLVLRLSYLPFLQDSHSVSLSNSVKKDVKMIRFYVSILVIGFSVVLADIPVISALGYRCVQNTGSSFDYEEVERCFTAQNSSKIEFRKDLREKFYCITFVKDKKDRKPAKLEFSTASFFNISATVSLFYSMVVISIKVT